MSLFKVAGPISFAFCPPHRLGSDGVVNLLHPGTPRHCLHCAGAQVSSGALRPLRRHLGRFEDAGADGDGRDGACNEDSGAAVNWRLPGRLLVSSLLVGQQRAAGILAFWPWIAGVRLRQIASLVLVL